MSAKLCYSTAKVVFLRWTFSLIPIFVIYFGLAYFYRFASQSLKKMESNSRSPLFAHVGATIQGKEGERQSAQRREGKGTEEKKSEAWGGSIKRGAEEQKDRRSERETEVIRSNRRNRSKKFETLRCSTFCTFSWKKIYFPFVFFERSFFDSSIRSRSGVHFRVGIPTRWQPSIRHVLFLRCQVKRRRRKKERERSWQVWQL